MIEKFENKNCLNEVSGGGSVVRGYAKDEKGDYKYDENGNKIEGLYYIDAGTEKMEFTTDEGIARGRDFFGKHYESYHMGHLRDPKTVEEQLDSKFIIPPEPYVPCEMSVLECFDDPDF